MSNDSSNAPPAPDPQYSRGSAELRANVKWVVSSFGTVAAAFVVGLQLTSLGQLSGERLVWALVSVAAVFAAILGIFGAAVRVLAPRGGTFTGFKKGRDFGALRTYLATDPAPLRKQAKTAAELAELYERALQAERDTWASHEADKANQTLKHAYEDAKTRRAALSPVVHDVTALGLYLRVKQLFQLTIRAIYIGVVIAAIGAVGFAYASSPPTKPTKPAPTPSPSVQVAVNEPKTCVDLYLALDELVRAKPNIGSHWPTGSLGSQDHACGFHSETELAHFLSFLARR